MIHNYFMPKLFLTLIMAIAGLCCAHAQTVEALKVTLNDGTSEVFVLPNKPKVTFSGDDVVVTSTALTKSYQRASVKKFTFVSVGAVNDIAADKTVYKFIDNVFTCCGADITVYNPAGMVVARGRDTVSIADHPNGVYIVKANNQTLKVVKR